MSTPKHTPGPWKAYGNLINRGTRAIAKAIPQLCEDEEKANARLIAASPELLEACKGFLATVEMLGPIQSCGFAADVKSARAAIDKATKGEAE